MILPTAIKKHLVKIRNTGRHHFDVLSAYDFGLPFLGKVQCNICGWKGRKFLDYDGGFGHVYASAECGSCKSHPRQRYFYIYLKHIIDGNKPFKVLHFAPEKPLTKLLSIYDNIDYLSVDIDPEKAIKQEDITRLSFKDGSFNMIICIHVLEHIPDDKKAMSELYRVLADDGFAILDAPIDYNRKTTFEDAAIITPKERTKAYWQWDHLRLYGQDFGQRLEDAGFKVKVDRYIESLGDEVIRFHGLEKNPIYLCTK